jgi:hypothetical protein
VGVGTKAAPELVFENLKPEPIKHLKPENYDKKPRKLPLAAPSGGPKIAT